MANSERNAGEPSDVEVRVNGRSVTLSEEQRKVVRWIAMEADLKPGDRMDDGTIYAGISPDTGKKMYTTPADATLTMKWRDAMEYATKLDAHGHKDWRVRTKNELNVQFNNRAAIGGFNESGSVYGGWYWSSDSIINAWNQRFSDGYRGWDEQSNYSSLRCVRG